MGDHKRKRVPDPMERKRRLLRKLCLETARKKYPGRSRRELALEAERLYQDHIRDIFGKVKIARTPTIVTPTNRGPAQGKPEQRTPGGLILPK